MRPGNPTSPPVTKIGNRFRRRRRCLPGQPDQYNHSPPFRPEEPVTTAALMPMTSYDIRSGTINLSAADSELLILLDGAAAIQLPAAEEGLVYEFFQMANNDVQCFADANNIIARNFTGASSIAYSTANQRVGAAFAMRCIKQDDDSLHWLFFALCNHTVTVA